MAGIRVKFTDKYGHVRLVIASEIGQNPNNEFMWFVAKSTYVCKNPTLTSISGRDFEYIEAAMTNGYVDLSSVGKFEEEGSGRW